MFQVNILSPKSPISAFASIDLPVKRAALLLFGSFVLGLLPHLLFSVPSAGEPTQGYLHGGLLIDFIGQRNPPKKECGVNGRRPDESITAVVCGCSDINTAIDNVGYYCDDDAKDTWDGHDDDDCGESCGVGGIG